MKPRPEDGPWHQTTWGVQQWWPVQFPHALVFQQPRPASRDVRERRIDLRIEGRGRSGQRTTGPVLWKKARCRLCESKGNLKPRVHQTAAQSASSAQREQPCGVSWCFLGGSECLLAAFPSAARTDVHQGRLAYPARLGEPTSVEKPVAP